MITSIIPCYNEEDCIAAAVKSVLWADEVIVVDSFSTDGTLDILAEYPEVRVVQHTYENSAAQKNWIIPQAKHEWILLLDADEVATPELVREVKDVIDKKVEYTAYSIPRENYFFGKQLKYVWKSDRVNRLFRRDLSRYQELEVHSKLETQGQLGQLHGVIEHHSFKSKDHYLTKMRRYARWSAKDYDEKTGRITVYHMVIKPLARFIKHYLVQGGLFDGKAGYLISLWQAKAVRWRYEEMRKMRAR